MSYISQRTVKGKKYYYLEESFKFNKKLVKESVYFGSMYPSNDEIFLGEEVLNKTCLARNHIVLVPPLTEFIRNRTAKIIDNAKTNYLKKLNENQIQKINKQKIQSIIEIFYLTEKKQIEIKNLKHLLEYYNEGILKNEPLTEIKIKKMHSLLSENIKMKNEEYDSQVMHLFLTWHKEKNDLIHQIEFAAKFCAKFYNLKLFKENNFILSFILMNYILEQKNFPFIIISNKKFDKFKKNLEEGRDVDNFKSITTFLIKEVIKQSEIKI